jgi:eukaryotic-like serine/threonine-protein kinase
MIAPSRIGDRYEVKELLGEGGMGIVYKAYDSQRKGYVALKTMKDAADPTALELFAQEWRTLANISHPNIVDIFNSGEFEEDGQRRPYFVMPLLPGRTLEKLIRDASHKLTAERVVDILIQTCRGLQAAHDHGLIHRDLKPSNLFVMNDDSVKIIDFGMVHLVDVRKTATGIKGTLQYMAPEQLELKDVTAATDIFSLGVVAYEALTGRKPFDRGTESATAQAIRNEFPPPASELNPAVNKVLGQVVAKAMAKGPWNRFSGAREFSEYLQKALKGEAIELFDTARILPRVERVRRALAEGDLEFANEILNDLQLEGRADSEITRLLEEVRQATRSKIVRQLLDSARMRLQESEFPLAWQKVQEALQRDPGNTEAQALQAEIETRRSDQQSEKWHRLVHQHLHNHAFTQARQAIEEIRKIRRDDINVTELIADADRRENEFRRACEKKEQQYESAMRAYSSGEISTALSKLVKIIEFDSHTQGFIVPGRDEVYRETYNRIRTEWESVQHAIAEIERVIAAGNLAHAAELAKEQCEKYPSDFGLQALKLKVEDLQRQEKSAYIAEIGRRLDAEPDLERGGRLLEEALERYPKEPHFQELAISLRKRKDLVDSIAFKARQYEEQNLITEALGQWNTLRSIYPQYAGLELEIHRVQLRLGQQKREEARLNWVGQIDRLLQTSDYDRAHSVALEALVEFPGDQELQSLNQLALERRERSLEGLNLMQQAKGLCEERRFREAIELLRRAIDLDPNNASIRDELATAFAGHAQVLLASDWRVAEPLIQEALRIAPANALAKSLRPSVLLAKRMESVDKCVSQARELQAAGDISEALVAVQEGLASYPNDSRLVQLQNALRGAIADQTHARRRQDLEELRLLSREVDEARDETSLTALFDRSMVLSKPYRDDTEFAMAVSLLHERAGIDRSTNKGDLAADAPVTPPVGREPEAVSPGQGATVNGWTRFRLRLLKWLAHVISSIKAKIASGLPKTSWRSLAGSIRERSGRLSWTQWAGLTAILIIAIALVSTWFRRPTPKPPSKAQPVSIEFQVSPDDAQILVDGKPIKGHTAKLDPGAHRLEASKLGYMPFDLPVSVNTNMHSVPLTLVPAPHFIRILADLGAAQVKLDDTEIGALQDGNFSSALPTAGPHTLRLLIGKKEVFSIQFQADEGAPTRLLSPPAAHDVPVVVASTLGPHALIYSSLPNIPAEVQNGEPQLIPMDGRDLTLAATDKEIVFQARTKPISLPVEIANNPMLTVRAGSANRGTLVIEANVDGAIVYLNDAKRPKPVQHGKWSGQVEPGDYKVRLTLDGYDQTVEQKLTITAGKNTPAKFVLTQTITAAYLRIEGGTPDADVWLDSKHIGKLDSAGSLAQESVTPDTEHSIRIEKENYESFETTRSAQVKETIVIAAAQAQLKPFGTLLFEVRPPEAKLTIQRTGEAPHDVSDNTQHLRGGAYIVTGTAGGYESYRHEERVVPGEHRTVSIGLLRKETPVIQDKRVEITDLFDESKNWKGQDDGFWIHDGPLYFKAPYFTHIIEVLKPKKGLLGQGKKVTWRIYLQGGDYIECQLDGSTFFRRTVIVGKPSEQVKVSHKTGGSFVRVEMTVGRDGVSQKVGQMVDNFPAKIGGRTGFVGKFGLRLVR